MINYKTKDKGMTYEYNNKSYVIYHDYFRVNSFEYIDKNVKMAIQNFSIDTIINPFADSNIELYEGIILKIAYIYGDDGNIRAHGYEVSNDAAIINELSALPKSKINIPKQQTVNTNILMSEIYSIITNLIKDNQLSELVMHIIQSNVNKFTTWPAAVSVHHNIKGGLLLHTRNVALIAHRIAVNYSDIDMDLVLSGAILHDIGKIEEYTEDCKISDVGKYRDHITIGQDIILNAWRTSNSQVDENTINRLLHIILAHHGKLEWGSPKIPATKEAFIVHQADYIDTNMYIYHNTYKEINFGDTAYNKLVGTYIVNENITTSQNYDTM